MLKVQMITVVKHKLEILALQVRIFKTENTDNEQNNDQTRNQETPH